MSNNFVFLAYSRNKVIMERDISFESRQALWDKGYTVDVIPLELALRIFRISEDSNDAT